MEKKQKKKLQQNLLFDDLWPIISERSDAELQGAHTVQDVEWRPANHSVILLTQDCTQRGRILNDLFIEM